MKSLDELLREAFERERIREEADPSIPVRRAAILKRLEEIERLRAEKAAAKKLPATEEERAKAQPNRLNLQYQLPNCLKYINRRWSKQVGTSRNTVTGYSEGDVSSQARHFLHVDNIPP